jgi:carboxyl-terminal processing protease
MKNYRQILLPLIFSLILTIGILIGNWYGSNFYGMKSTYHYFRKNGNKEDRSNSDKNFSLFPRANKLNSVITYVENEYVDTVSIDKITDAAIPTILEGLDPHSVYIPASEVKKYNEPLIGNFSGIGVQFNMNDDTVAIINTIPNGPSEIVGILAGDRIIKVNEENVSGVKMRSDSVVARLKGPKGTSVRVAIKRIGIAELLDFEITRDDIPLYSVDVAYMVNKNTGYVKINTFAQTTYDEFISAIQKLHSLGMTKLILDLRNNGGGVMDAATKIADEFLDGNKLIVYTQGRARARYDVISTQGGISKNDELVILIDELSASASEILAGAIQDNDRGIIIGRRSFGKGLVQEQIQFYDGSAMRLTIARYYTPTGRCIQKPYNTDRNHGFEGSKDLDNLNIYDKDLENRFKHGEYQNADSIHFTDSLKYITPGGKTVYGGGGIMPDIFIPIDTIGFSPYFYKVGHLGLIYRFAFNYADKNRNILARLKTADEISSYLDKSEYFSEFLRFADSKGVPKNNADLKISKKLIETQIKAYIARNVIDNMGFYPIIMEIDNTLQKAIGVLN